MEVDLYVPFPGTDLWRKIWAGSGVVGSEVGDTERLRLDYEGDSDLYPRYVERVRRAADRHCWERGSRRGYPTNACAYVDPNQVVRVGQYDTDDERILVTNEEALTEWLQIDVLVEEELTIG